MLVQHETLVFERMIRGVVVTSVFAAFADATCRAVWAVPPTDQIVYDEANFHVGQRDVFRCGSKDSAPAIGGTTYYWEIVPNRRIVSTETLTPINDDTKGPLAVSLITTEFHDDVGVTTGDEDAVSSPSSLAAVSTTIKCTVQMTSLVGPDMIRGFEVGHNGALDGLVRYFSPSSATAAAPTEAMTNDT